MSTEKFNASLYPNCLTVYPNGISKWNKLDPELRHASELRAVFVHNPPPPPTKSVSVVHNPRGLYYLNQLGLVSPN